MKKLSAVVAAVALLSSSRLAGQNNWISFGQDPGGTKFSTLDADQREERQGPEARLDVPHRRQVRLLREHAARHRRRHVFQRAERRLRARRRDRPADLEVRDDRTTTARTDLLARRRRAGAAAVSRPTATAWRRSTPRPARSSRASARRGSFTGLRMSSPPVDLQEHPDHAGRRGHRQGVGHRHRRAAVDVEPEGAARRSRTSATWLNDSSKSHVRRRACGDLHRRRRARPAVRAGRESRQRLLRRPAPRQQPVQRLAAGRRCEHRQDQVVPAARASRHLGLRPRRAADARRRAPQRADDAAASRSSRRWASCSSSTAKPASRCTAWKSGRCRRPRAKGEWTSPTQPFPLKPAPLARNSLKKEELAEGHAGARGALQGALGEVQPVGRGALQPVAREAGHRRVPGRDRWRQLAGRDVQPSARADDHQRHERGAVGTSRRAARPARRGPARRARR